MSQFGRGCIYSGDGLVDWMQLHSHLFFFLPFLRQKESQANEGEEEEGFK